MRHSKYLHTVSTMHSKYLHTVSTMHSRYLYIYCCLCSSNGLKWLSCICRCVCDFYIAFFASCVDEDVCVCDPYWLGHHAMLEIDFLGR